jgi:hypothetical protein
VRYELIFEDPVLGVMPLDDTLPIEIWRMKGSLSRQKWQTTDVRGLYAELILSGAIDNPARFLEARSCSFRMFAMPRTHLFHSSYTYLGPRLAFGKISACPSPGWLWSRACQMATGD